MVKAVGTGFPGLRAIEQQNANAARNAEMVEPPSEIVGIDWAAVELGIEAGRAERDDLAGNNGWRPASNATA
jgi:hypothetical protein